MNIERSVPTWILSRLFDEDLPIPRKNLLKNLCQASFSSMNDNDFSETIEQLEKEGLIEFERKEGTEFLPLTEANTMSPTGTSTRYERVSKTYAGYVITETGIIEFRKKIVTPIEKIKPHIDSLAEYKLKKFKSIVDKIKHSSNVLKDVVKLCIDNAPLVLDFIKVATAELSNIGISLSG